jgi:hypothetical protein
VRAGLALLALALLAAGCGSGDEPDVPDAQALPPSAYGRPDPAAGRLLLRFVRAGRRRDMAAMWSLLSSETRASYGGTLKRFRGKPGSDIADDFELLRGEHVVLSRRVGRFGVAALGGRRPPDEGEEPEDYAFAAAFVRERGGWRLDLGGLAIELLKPGPLDETDGRPEVAAQVDAAGRVHQALLWLDGRPFAAARTSELPFTAELEGRPPQTLRPGVHRVVVFATGGGAAAAVAWPFLVDR